MQKPTGRDRGALPPQIRGLLAPGRLAPGEGAPALVQTHGSYVLLTTARVYKLKKPLDLGFLDYSSLERRRAACEAEVTLNRRLTTEVYLGVQPVVHGSGGYALSGEGEAVDYVVVMRRLPEARMLDNLVARDAVPADLIARLAQRLASFYATAPTGGAIDTAAEPAALLALWQENFAQTLPYVDRTIGAARYRRIAAAVYADLLRLRPLLSERIAAGRARDGHGDLRLSAVCVEDAAIQIYDCIEFDARYRHGDVAADIAFLAMDFDAHGRPDLADEFVAAYVAASGDDTLPAVLPFYRCYRASVRGKVYSMQLAEPEIGPAQQRNAARAARARFRLAAGYLSTGRPGVTLVLGSDGPRRHAVAVALAARLGAVLLGATAETAAAAGARLRQRIPVVVTASPESPRLLTELREEAARRRVPRRIIACEQDGAPPGAVIVPAANSIRATLQALHAQRFFAALR